MATDSRKTKQRRAERASQLFAQADRNVDKGDYHAAFQLFLAAAKAGDSGAMVNLGTFYGAGRGVRVDHQRAIYWYTRAYKRGEAAAANNIGIVWSDQGKFTRAMWWFKRAVQMGDDSAHLEIAKIYLRNMRDTAKAISHLEKVRASERVSEADEEEAERLMRKVNQRLNPVRRSRDWLQ